MNQVLAIIPARGGSKGIPRKNVLPLGGFPLIAYSIAAAQAAADVSRVLVSTDDEEIAQVARAWGAEVPFLRPAEISGDDTTDLPVFQHALRWLRDREDYAPDIVVHLRPTSPFRTLQHISLCIEALRRNSDAQAARTVSTPAQNPFKMYTAQQGKFLQPLIPGQTLEPVPRQQLPPVWWHNGLVDSMRSEIVLGGSMCGNRIVPIETEAAIDLDTLMEWHVAEQMLCDGEMKLDFVLRRPD